MSVSIHPIIIWKTVVQVVGVWLALFIALALSPWQNNLPVWVLIVLVGLMWIAYDWMMACSLTIIVRRDRLVVRQKQWGITYRTDVYLFSQINFMNVEQGMLEQILDAATLTIVTAQRQKIRYHWLTPVKQLRRAIG